MSNSHATKICRKCKTEKTAAEFHKSKINKDGLMSYCAKCRNAHASAIRSDEIRAKERARYNANHDKRRAYSNAWQLANNEKVKQYSKKYYENNKDKCRKSTEIWKNNHIERRREIKRLAQNRRWARYHRASGVYTETDINKLFEAQRKKCAICKTSIINKYHIDHVVPLSKGGSNDKDNLQLLCPLCNIRKGAKDPILFMQSVGNLL